MTKPQLKPEFRRAVEALAKKEGKGHVMVPFDDRFTPAGGVRIYLKDDAVIIHTWCIGGESDTRASPPCTEYYYDILGEESS